MQPFPAITSTLSPKYLGNYVVEQYGFNANTNCRIIKIGVNHTYIIENDTCKYVFRVYNLNWRTKAEIKAELDLLLLLNDNQISVAYPIKDKTSNYIQVLQAAEGLRYAVLFTYAIGDSIVNPTKKHCLTLGLEMAKMHLITANKTINRINYNADTLVNWALNQVESTFSKPLESINFIKRANTIIASQFKKANTNALRSGIVHFDLWYENIKIENETNITFFDFDNCGNGWLFLDLAYSIMVIFRNEPNKDVFKEKMNALIEGYQSVTPISDEEKRLIPYGGLAIWLYYGGIHAQRFNDFSSIFYNENFLNYWIQTVDKWMKFNNIDI
ncbi:hypothetical protein GCM10022291_23630 [Postechiella marina]|uniref:Aminoglycoside phosphotransferase domain-containing protein n=1 Tax=Postechiella marina TaxID=943941 RepID=A0ABP8CC36_9FLAO